MDSRQQWILVLEISEARCIDAKRVVHGERIEER